MILNSNDADNLNFNRLVNFCVRNDCKTLHRTFDEFAEVEADGGACQYDCGITLIRELFDFLIQRINHAAHGVGVEADI